MDRSSFTIPPPDESEAPRNKLAELSYWFGLASPWCCILAPVSIGMGWVALKQIKKEPGAFSGRNWAMQGIFISIFSMIAISALIYLGGKYAWDWW